MGAVAAFIVPLFPNTMSSNLIETIVDKNGQYQAAELLTFIGLCLLASIFAIRFLLAILNGVLQDEIYAVKVQSKKIARAQRVHKVMRRL